jgi:hypothetical protein
MMKGRWRVKAGLRYDSLAHWIEWISRRGKRILGI